MRRLLISSIVVGGLVLAGCGGSSSRVERATACRTAAQIADENGASAHDVQSMLATLKGASADLTRDVADYKRAGDDYARDDVARQISIDCGVLLS